MLETSNREGAIDSTSPPEVYRPSHDGTIGLLDLLLVLVEHQWSILRVTFIAAVAGCILALLLPKSYVGQAVILTPKQPLSLSDALLGQPLLSGLASSDSLGLTDPNDVYLAMLRSRSIEQAIAQKFQLASYYETDTWVDTLEALDGDTSISSGHDGTITIRYEHKDPKVAADIANAYVGELQNLIRKTAISAAEQRRLFFQDQFKAAKEQLANAEVELRKSQESSGILDIDKQASAIVGSIAQLRGQIAAQEILLRGLKSFGTDRNPDVVRAQEQLETMRRQLSDLEKRNPGGDGDLFVASKKLPASGLEYIRNLRNVKYYEAVYDVLGKQYEAAVVDSGGGGASVQVIEPAVPRDKKSKPRRMLIVLACMFLAAFGSCVWFCAAELVRRVELDSEEGPKMRALRRALRPQWRYSPINLLRLKKDSRSKYRE